MMHVVLFKNCFEIHPGMQKVHVNVVCQKNPAALGISKIFKASTCRKWNPRISEMLKKRLKNGTLIEAEIQSLDLRGAEVNGLFLFNPHQNQNRGNIS